MNKDRPRADATRPQAQQVLLTVLDGIVRLIHPVMPFVAETLWQVLNRAAPVRGLAEPKAESGSLAYAQWPTMQAAFADEATDRAVSRMQDLVRGIREIRNRYMLDKTPLNLSVHCSDNVRAELEPLAPFVRRLGLIQDFDCGPAVAKPRQAGAIVRADYQAYIPLAGLIDPAVETKRIEKQLQDIAKQTAGMRSKLSSESYLNNAPPEVVEETRTKLRDLDQQATLLQASLGDLAG